MPELVLNEQKHFFAPKLFLGEKNASPFFLLFTRTTIILVTGNADLVVYYRC